MEEVEARILLGNLIERMRCRKDGSRQLPGVVTERELAALHLAVVRLGGVCEPVALPVVDVTPAPEPAEDVPEVEEDTEVTPPPVLAAEQDSPPAEKPREASITASVSPLASEPESGPGPVAEPSPSQEESLPASPASVPEPEPDAESEPEPVQLNLQSLTAPPPSANARICLDFGTAMSKVTLVSEDDDSPEGEEMIEVLHLGEPGDQEEISETMLISSVYIDNAGLLWFGKAARDRSMVEGRDGSRQRLDNIKRRLSEDGWEETLNERLNPTGLAVTYGEMVLAYMMFLTWAVGQCLSQLGYPNTLKRRYAMPCLSGSKGRETVHRLRRIVGEAQVLADTFADALTTGLPLVKFIETVRLLRTQPREYTCIGQDVTEPLGVAGSIINSRSSLNELIMVIDVGAGTSDFSLFRIRVDPESGIREAREIEGASRGVQKAGNHLDHMLSELISRKCGLSLDDPMWKNIRSALDLQIRDYKETLFTERSVFVTLMNGAEAEITLKEFLELPAVRQFGEDLRSTMVKILEDADASLVNWVQSQPEGRLVVTLTGGGAELPMVHALAKSPIQVHGSWMRVIRSIAFPKWLRELDEGLEADYPRIAVSLGGARRHLIHLGKPIHMTAGDSSGTPVLEHI